MDKRRWNQRKATKASCSEEVTSVEWKVVVMSEQEDDLIFRMYKLVGDRWSLIAGRIPGRTPEVIERYWLMKHSLILFSQIDEEDNFVSLYFPRLRLRKKNNNILV